MLCRKPLLPMIALSVCMLGNTGCKKDRDSRPIPIPNINLSLGGQGSQAGDPAAGLPPLPYPDGGAPTASTDRWTPSGPAAPTAPAATGAPSAPASASEALNLRSLRLTGMLFEALVSRQSGSSYAQRRLQALRTLDVAEQTGAGPAPGGVAPQAPSSSAGAASGLPAFGDRTAAVPAAPAGPGATDPKTLENCFHNQRYIATAVEVHNQRFNTKLTTLDDRTVDQLVKSGCLSEGMPDDPGQGPRTWSHYKLTGGNQPGQLSTYNASFGRYEVSGRGAGITCTVHGSETSACHQLRGVFANVLMRYAREQNLKPERVDAALINDMIAKGYLRERPTDPGSHGLEGIERHYKLTASSPGIACDVHGAGGGV